MRYAAAFSLLLAAAPAAAQGHDDHRRDDHAERAQAGAENPSSQPKPDGWVVRLDRPERGTPEDVMFTEMSPGWHITTGPAALLYHPDSTASGAYRLEADVFLFDPAERHEGYGVFFGGSDLDGPDQMYTYLLLRQDGRYLVKVRDGDATAVVRDWTEHPAINAWAARPESDATVRNRLAVEVGANDVAFLVNGTEVARVSRADLPPTDGVFGLRVNHALNLHVTSLTATP